jgi:hypothetical protein
MEDTYDQLHNPLRGYIEIEVRDREGRIVGRGRHEMRSFVNNLLRGFEAMMKTAGGVKTEGTVIDTGGASKAIGAEWYTVSGYSGGGSVMATKSADNDDSYGIMVGSGTTGLALDQYAPASKIPHGTGSEQLDYGVSVIEDLGLDTGVTPPVYRFRLSRTFSNLSGAAININEVCIAARNYWSQTIYGTAYDAKYMIARDALPSTYTVPNGGSATVVVTVEVVVG